MGALPGMASSREMYTSSTTVLNDLRTVSFSSTKLPSRRSRGENAVNGCVMSCPAPSRLSGIRLISSAGFRSNASSSFCRSWSFIGSYMGVLFCKRSGVGRVVDLADGDRIGTAVDGQHVRDGRGGRSSDREILDRRSIL